MGPEDVSLLLRWNYEIYSLLARNSHNKYRELIKAKWKMHLNVDNPSFFL